MPNDIVIELWHHGGHWSLKKSGNQYWHKGKKDTDTKWGSLEYSSEVSRRILSSKTTILHGPQREWAPHCKRSSENPSLLSKYR